MSTGAPTGAGLPGAPAAVAPEPDVPGAPRVLIVRLGAMGDVVLALPALRRLRRALPAARIGWAIEEAHAPLLAGDPDLDRLHVARTRAWRKAPLAAATRREVAAWIGGLRGEGYDLALDLQGLVKSAVVARASGARLRVGLPPGRTREPLSSLLLTGRAAAVADVHASALYEAAADAAVRALGGEPAVAMAPGPLLLPGAEEEAWAASEVARRGLEPLVVVNPGAAWVTKRWPAERFGRLARALAEDGAAVWVAYGPGEEPLARQVVDSAAHPRVTSFATSLRELAALLARARLVVAGDTGPYHLAQAVGTPTLGLFGPTDPARNGPRAPGDRVIWRPPACSPCYGRTCPTQIECLTGVDVELVLAAARELLGRGSAGEESRPRS